MIRLDAEGRAAGDNIIAQCDEPNCKREMPRDYLHCCFECQGFFCWSHIGISDYGLLCGPCYAVRKNEAPRRTMTRPARHDETDEADDDQMLL